MAIAAALLYEPDMPAAELDTRYTNSASRFTEVSGLRVHYRDEGQGPPVLLLHGMASSLHTWDGWADALQAEFRVIRLDLPGFGLTGPRPDGDYSIERDLEFLDAFAKQLGLDSFHLGGNSLGGLIAWRYALTRPQRVRRLILVDAAGYPRSPPSPAPFVIRLARLPVISRLLTLTAPRSIYRRSVFEVYGDPAKVTDAVVERYYELSLRPGNRQAFVDRARALFTVADEHGPAPATIRQPTLVIWGAADRWIPLGDGEAFAGDIPNAELAVFPGAGHVPMEEIPLPTAAAARRFLAADAAAPD